MSDAAIPITDLSGTRAKVADTVASAREAVSNVAATATDQFQSATRRAADTVDSNPLVILAGGIAAGVLAGLLLPRTDRETELLRPISNRIGDGLSSAIQAGRDAGKTELDNMGINADAARDTGRKLIDSALKAAATAGQAAAKAGQDAVQGS